ncbi:esterase [Ramlibacter tataouinensis]|uniref:esterase n=1 Tax=Ramlibacter tataouinensis TaxID=94132 RepID=UPI0022F3A80E|nr:esterase [Ramlibacter tataouinensis]WBY01351.1 esterase [Ramlibacter tataouinensis]
MNDASIVAARPQGPATELVLLFHGVGASAANLLPLAEWIAAARPGAFVVSVDAPQPSGLGGGREWFSVLGVTEDNRMPRIDAAMPLFRQAVAHWQRESGAGAERTTLIGFSQGSIMSLESTQDGDPLAARVVALSGRFAQPPRRAPAAVRFHFIHGADDPVIAARFSVEAAQALERLGGRATVDVLPGLAHGIDARAAQLAAGYLA